MNTTGNECCGGHGAENCSTEKKSVLCCLKGCCGSDLAALVARLTLAVVIFPHGAQKVLGWFGGYGFTGTMQAFTEQMGIPYIFALLALAAEFLAPIGLVTGLLTRLAAFGIVVTMVVAAVMAHLPYGFFMNWGGKQAGEGFEYHILAAGLGLTIMLLGAGKFSLDAKFCKKCCK